MKASLYPYTRDPIEQGMLIKAEDVLELRKNIEKLLSDFHAHIGTTVNNYGADDDNTTRQHAIATSSTSGFAPYYIYDKVIDYENKYNALKTYLGTDLYPELSIVVWAGDYNDKLPDGWVFCDGESILYEDPITGEIDYAPNLIYCEPVSVSSDRVFLSKKTGISRTNVSSSTGVLGKGITKYYIIKKPTSSVESDEVNLTVVQPTQVRVATPYTKHTKEELEALSDGSRETVTLPIGTEIIVSTFNGSDYEADGIYIKEASKASKEYLTKNSFKLAEDTIVSSDVWYNKVKLTIVQPSNNVQLETNYTEKGTSTSVYVPYGEIVTITSYPTTKHKVKNLWVKHGTSENKEILSSDSFVIKDDVVLSADVEEITAYLEVVQPTEVRLGTNYTTNNKDTLLTFADGHKEDKLVPIGATVAFTPYNGNIYEVDKYYIKKASGTIEYLSGNSFEFDGLTQASSTIKYVNYTFTIKASAHQVIQVIHKHRGTTYTHTSNRTQDVTFSVNYGDTWSASIISVDTGYDAGSISKSSGTITGNYTLYNTTATLKKYKFTIKATKNQTITVNCGGTNHYSDYISDVSFTCYYFEYWTATITPATGYGAGSIVGATSGTISENVTKRATNAYPLVLYATASINDDIYYHTNSNGCLLIGEEFDFEEARNFSISIEYNISGTAWGASGCWSGSGFTVLAESKYTLNTGSKMEIGTWDKYRLGDNTGGAIPYNAETLKTHPWGDFSNGIGASGNYGGKCVATQCYNGNTAPYGPITTGSGSITIPAGKSHIALIYNVSCSKKDGASFVSSTCSGQTYTVKVTLTPTT